MILSLLSQPKLSFGHLKNPSLRKGFPCWSLINYKKLGREYYLSYCAFFISVVVVNVVVIVLCFCCFLLLSFEIQKNGKTVSCTFFFWTGIVDTPIWTGTKAREYEFLWRKNIQIQFLESPALNCCTSISWSKINNSISKKERGMLSVIIKNKKVFGGLNLSL